MKNKKTTAMVAVIAAPLLAPVATAQDTIKKTINYSYIEGAFAHDNFNANRVGINDRDGIGNTADDNFGTLGDATGNGGGGRLSVALPFGSQKVGFHTVADYLQTSHDAGIAIADQFGTATASGLVNLNQKEFRAAVGLHSRASPHFSVFAELGFTNNKIDFGDASLVTPGGPVSASFAGASGSRTAFDARLGMRAIAFSRLEVTGYARYHGNGKLQTAEDGTIGFGGKVVAGAGVYYHLTDRFQFGGDYEFGTPGRVRLVARVSF